MSKGNKSNKNIMYIIAFLIIVIIVGSVFFARAITQSNTKNSVLYINEGMVFSFSDQPTGDTTVPGPQLTFEVGDVVNMTVYNKGTLVHGWEVVSGVSSGNGLFNSTGAIVVFNSQISNIQPGQSASIIFTVNQAGNFNYISPVATDPQNGLWGEVTVVEATPTSTSSPTPTSTPIATQTANGSPSPAVPELSWLVIPPFLLSVFAVAVVIRRRKTANLKR